MKAQKSSIITKIDRRWHEVDASAMSLGRVATRIATLLRGKHKRTFTPNVDGGDFVVVTNVDKLKFTGRKVEQKTYYRHSGYLGGLKETSLKVQLERKPEWVLRQAVRSMLDEVRFRNAMLARMKIVVGTEHTYPIVKK
ncbi:MAG: 50S ribosomal protein L13 [Candidatus Doudnabacteria bacterium]|nr:50S ribosomal protein L13 [Candidatus Doudnabacteria bacterium]